MKVVGKRFRLGGFIGSTVGALFFIIALIFPSNILFFISGVLFVVAIVDFCYPAKKIFVDDNNVLIKPSAQITVFGQIALSEYYIIPFASIKKIISNVASPKPENSAARILGGAAGVAISAAFNAASNTFLSIITESGQITITHISNPNKIKKKILENCGDLANNIE